MKFDYFNFIDSELYCENVPLRKIAEKYGTPFYAYSKNSMITQYKLFTEAFSSINHQIFYASKANTNINIMKLFHSLGAGLDVNSDGELYRALKIGANPKNILFTGVGKTPAEIEMGLKHDIFLFKAESYQEIQLMNDIAKKLNKKARIAIRINPDVDPHVHKYIATGLNESKFGISQDQAFEIFKFAKSLPNIDVIGIDMHIGSQIIQIDVFREAIEILIKLKHQIQELNIELTHVDIGGGLGIQYNDEKAPTAKEFAELILPYLQRCSCKIIFEPGRFLVGNAGVIVSKVLYTKRHLQKEFLIIDAAMTELIRPAIYDAYHHIYPLREKPNDKLSKYDVVGPVCENGDYIALDRTLPPIEQNELIAIMSAGAYGAVMGSNYNSRRKPPEILVDGDEFFLIRERESYEDLIKNEILVL